MIPASIAVVMPLRNDWTSAAELIRRLDLTIPRPLRVLLIDDGSVQPCDPSAFQAPYKSAASVEVLVLRRNLGHQRAIAIGLTHIHQTMHCDAVLVMDADGEDTPEGALQLIERFEREGGGKAVFAERSRRTESATFRAFYGLYKALHLLLTGIRVRVGNFSALPAAYLRTLVVMPELWNHYAAAVFRSGLPFAEVPIPRGKRIAGESKMNFVSLVVHGLSAISVFGETVGVRLLIGSLVGTMLAGAGILTVTGVRFFTDAAIPGWATYAAGTLAVVAIQFITLAISFTFTILSSRSQMAFVPLRDHAMFVAEVRALYQCEPNGKRE